MAVKHKCVLFDAPGVIGQVSIAADSDFYASADVQQLRASIVIIEISFDIKKHKPALTIAYHDVERPAPVDLFDYQLIERCN